ncbi:hypothetical protein J6590_080985 [Homalodisca vitripennis]|nr:hypothetical protein J6590_080985 [Homalodisca vitripennis]
MTYSKSAPLPLTAIVPVVFRVEEFANIALVNLFLCGSNFNKPPGFNKVLGEWLMVGVTVDPKVLHSTLFLGYTVAFDPVSGGLLLTFSRRLNGSRSILAVLQEKPYGTVSYRFSYFSPATQVRLTGYGARGLYKTPLDGSFPEHLPHHQRAKSLSNMIAYKSQLPEFVLTSCNCVKIEKALCSIY